MIKIFLLTIPFVSLWCLTVCMKSQHGEALYWWKLIVDRVGKNDFWKKPLYSCPSCMPSFHGAIILVSLYLFKGYDFRNIIPNWLIVVSCCSFINSFIFNYFIYIENKIEEQEKNKYVK